MTSRLLLNVLLVLLSTVQTIQASPYAARCQNFKVALDIGHTFKNPGAISARGQSEFSFNLRLARQIHAGLASANIESFLINDDGAINSLADRTVLAALGGATLFVSVHHDSVQPHYLSEWIVDDQIHRFSDHFRGFSLFVSQRNPAYPESLYFATLLGEQLLAQALTPTLHHAEPIAGENRPLLNEQLGIYRFDNLFVLRTATMPAVLFEAGVIVHRDEELDLSDQDYRARHVNALVAAVHDFCRSVESAKPDRVMHSE